MFCFFAHPDDEVLCAGVTIHKLVNGDHKVAIPTMVCSAGARANLLSISFI